MKNPVQEMYLEQMIKKSWKNRDYIRCKNLVNFANKYYPGNEIGQKYKRKISKINIKKEYIRYVRNFNDNGILFIILEVISIYFTYLIFIKFFGIENFEYTFIFYFIAILLLIRFNIFSIYNIIYGKKVLSY
ncbi:hypothetical protein [Candidatus Vampirococcus lugosii]|uniref:Uncharacterized protein n=1 Tax=Candidatus Vampirococcus lugosii TaxID=2789015 RepID=A0ABS5QMT4_9BACT|nr:hypothetical protein [Candidatus Vampirococcus lugosii]MBS8122001.1 hypothetical protein [Candidatus Vampirococcus lugosii]